MRMRDEDDHHAMLEAGKAWRQVRAGQQRLWSDWTLVIGPGLMKARTEAMSIAGTNQPMGRGYNTAMGELLREYRLDDMGQTTRAHILKIMEHYADVEEWRTRQKDPADLNHPSRVWLKYRHSAKQTDQRDADKRAKSPAKETEQNYVAALEEIKALKADIERLEARIVKLEEGLAGARKSTPSAAAWKRSADAPKGVAGFGPWATPDDSY